MSDIKTRVTGKVNFVRYYDGNLWYRCEDGFEFPVPTSDCGSAHFEAHDKAIYFMRWIKKHMKTISEGRCVATLPEGVHALPGNGDSSD